MWRPGFFLFGARLHARILYKRPGSASGGEDAYGLLTASSVMEPDSLWRASSPGTDGGSSRLPSSRTSKASQKGTSNDDASAQGKPKRVA